MRASQSDLRHWKERPETQGCLASLLLLCSKGLGAELGPDGEGPAEGGTHKKARAAPGGPTVGRSLGQAPRGDHRVIRTHREGASPAKACGVLDGADRPPPQTQVDHTHSLPPGRACAAVTSTHKQRCSCKPGGRPAAAPWASSTALKTHKHVSLRSVVTPAPRSTLAWRSAAITIRNHTPGKDYNQGGSFSTRRSGGVLGAGS